MAKIVIGFSKPNKWMPYAWLIQKAYGISYDHVYIRIHSDKYSRDIIYQASKTMVNFMGLTMFTASNDIVQEFEFDITDDQMTAVMQFAIDNVSKEYGVIACIGLAIVKIASWCGKTIKNPFNDNEATYFCSALVAQVLKNLGYALPDAPEDLDPKEVFQLVQAIKTNDSSAK